MDWHGSWVAVASLEFDGKRAEEQKGLPFPGRRGGQGEKGWRGPIVDYSYLPQTRSRAQGDLRPRDATTCSTPATMQAQ